MVSISRGWATCIVLALFAATARAQVHELPGSLAQAVLAEQSPSALTPTDFDEADFEVVRVDGDDESVRVRLEPRSLHWVRAGRWVVVPRAVVRVEARGAEAATVAHAGFSHPLVPDGAGVSGAVPVALLSTDETSLVVETRRGQSVRRAGFALRFRPRPEHAGRVLFDSSCSPYGLSVQAGRVPSDSWLYVGCRLVRTKLRGGTVPTLELYMVWDHAGSSVTIDGVPTLPTRESLYTHRVGAAPGALTLGARGALITLGYRLPPVWHAGFVGAGLGPYYYEYHHAKESLHTAAPLVTVYAGYSIDPLTRIVYFNATATHERGYSDQGLYLWIEQFRFFDDRISMNLLLGANLLLYRRGQRWVSRINAPQGIEFIYRDFLGVNHNLTLGGFYYPDIYGSAYYNVWLRWGSPRFFGEVNYLEWREPHHTGSTRTQSMGVTFGMPLLRFL